MIHRLYSKLEPYLKNWINRSRPFCLALSNKIKKHFLTISQKISPPKRCPNFITIMTKRWKIILGTLFIFLSIFYGLGAIVSAPINNRLDVQPKTSLAPGQYSLAALAYVLKTQVDDTAWTPALPLIFPAAILDNLPNFQLGVKNSTNFFIKKLAHRYQDKHLGKAQKLLDYPPDIWLFSQTQEDTLAPGSAKLYRRALAQIKKAIIKNKTPATLTTADFLSIINDINSLISQKIAVINQHILEHNSETIDLKADDIFYQTSGTAYTLHYLLTAIIKDYKEQILSAEQYENITSALKFLKDAASLEPLLIKNAALTDSFAANHLAYLVYYLAQAQNKLQQIYYQTLLQTMESQPCPSTAKE